jgi:hypothetical protein
VSKQARASLLVAAVAAVCILSIAGVVWFRARELKPAALMTRLPRGAALVLYVDFDALRRAGFLQLLAGTKVATEPEYESFVRKTQFDYRKDLDSALVSFAPNGKFLLLKGRFDWKSLQAYVDGENGKCFQSLCRMAGSAPERQISFFPLRSGLMALAVSADDGAALRLNTAAPEPGEEVPDAPVWFSIPPSVLKSPSNLPDGARMFARGMERAESITLGFAPEGSRLAARLNVRCRNAQDAADVAAQLTGATTLLRNLIAREHQHPNPADLSGVLTSGSFRGEGRRVVGYWPIDKAFVESVLAP